MENKKALEEALSMDYSQLVPSKLFKSELFFLTHDEFEILSKHITDGRVSEDDYDTIIICNRIFKKIN